MPGKVAKSAFSLEELPISISKIFDQAQISTANHHKNFVALYKLQCEAAKLTDQRGKGIKLTGERAFGEVYLKMLARILPVKKGATVVDRVVKFVSGYIKFINEKAAEKKAENRASDDEDDEETPAARLVSRLLKWLFHGFVAKDKAVRYRVVQLVAEMVANLGEIDEEVYHTLRSSLLDRVTDKEPPIRVQSVIALSKLCGTEDPADIQDGQPTVVDVLIETLAHDPSADVRRTALLNIPVSPATLGPILQRTRDTDTTIRKLVYTAVLEPNTLQSATSFKSMGITHPRVLSIAQRELIIRNGVGDREPAVKSAAAALLGTWIDVIGEGDEGQEDNLNVETRVVQLLKLLDLVDSKIAEDALLNVFESRVDVFDNLEFGDAYWTNLTPEKAFLARVFVDCCISNKADRRLEAALPVVTSLAFRIQGTYNELCEDIQAEQADNLLGGVEEEERARREDERLDKEFVIAEMCKLAINLDYADEIGRRKMFQLVRDMISQETLPEGLVARCLDVLRTLSVNERDLIRVVVEVIHDLRDPNDSDDEQARDEDGETNVGDTPTTARPASSGPKPAAEQTPEERARADAIDLKCLSLCIGMLERVNGTFEENSTLEGILGELIIPAVKRKELPLREKGLISLGLCCLIAKRMALNSFQLFISQVQTAPEVLKLRVLQIVFDILMVHENEFLGKEGPQGEMIIMFMLYVLENEESEKVQALQCAGIAKLLLAGIISDERLLKTLVLLYLSPTTTDNQELRQCLSYFLPVYCYSSPINQRRMQSIFIPVFERMIAMRQQVDEDEEIVSPSQVAGMFVDWTDPQKAVDLRGQTADELVQFDMAGDVIKALLSLDMSKDDKKVLCQILGKLYIPDVVDDDKLRTLKLLVHNLQSRRPLRDTSANAALVKFDGAISKKFEKQLEDFNEDEYRKLEELKELFEFLDDIIPDDEDEEEAPKKRMARKRRSMSIATTTTDCESTETTSAGSKRSKSQAKRRRVSATDDEASFGDDQSTSALPVEPTRRLPRRSAAPKILLDEDEDSGDDDDEDATSAPRRRAAPVKSKHRSEEAKLDAEIDELLDEGVSKDSLLDDDSDSEGEVNDLLASSD